MADQQDNQQQGWPALNLREMANLGRAIQDVRWIGDRPFAVAPRDSVVFDLEAFNQTPGNKKAQVDVDRVQSLSDYVNKYAGHDGATMAFADLSSATIQAVLDYHRPDKNEPRWCEHLVNFTLTETREWRQWMKMNERSMPQVEFAEFLEDRIVDVIDPPAADLMSLVQTLEAKRNVNFSSAVRLENGTIDLTYEEDIQTTGRKAGGGKGKVEVPPKIKLGIRPFEGLDKWEVEARLRYRLKEGSVIFWYAIVEPDRVREAAFDEQVEQFEKDCNIRCIRGRLADRPFRDRVRVAEPTPAR
jgi:uncharacterized protein YfdQ (DUF2303 family)